MKQWFLLLAGFFLLLTGLQAQNDTVPYKVGTYDIKKQTKVFAVAEKLSVDPQVIVRLNKFRNPQQDLYPGQRIKVPVYPKGYVFEPEKVIVRKTIELDSAKLKLLYDDTALTETPQPEEPSQYAYYTADQARERLAMVDVLLEMNEAMLQGIKASIDTLVANDNVVVDEKNIQAMLLKMKRSRDKALLMPYLEHIRDSVGTEIITLQKDKKVLERIIAPPVVQTEEPLAESLPQVVLDTVVTGSDTIVYQTMIDTVTGTREQTVQEIISPEVANVEAAPVKVEVKKSSKSKKGASAFAYRDTIIVYDAAPVLASLKPEPEKKKFAETQLVPRGQFWDTARAVAPTDTAAFTRPLELPKDTNTVIKIKVPNSYDSLVIKPIKVAPMVKVKDTIATATKDTAISKPAPSAIQAVKDSANLPPIVTAMPPALPKDSIVAAVNPPQAGTDTMAAVVKDTVQPIIAATTLPATDTVKSVPVLPPPVKKAGVADMAIASADSVRRIKAEFFYKRAIKAMGEKNFRNAEQYLVKSIELSPRYYEAWFALAEMNDLLGVQAKALKDYQMCQSIDSTRPTLFYKMGMLYNKLKRKTEAYNSFNRAIGLRPDYIQALMERAALLADWRRYPEALRDYNVVIKENRSYHYAYKARGQVYMLNRNYKEAIDDFTRYLIFEETDPAAFYYRGLAKIGNNELLDGCLDLSTASGMGYAAAERAIKKSCE